MRIPLYQVDAFTDRPFAGNPAAVCPLPSWLPDETLQSIAAENNLSETAFLVAREDGYDLRWCTPELEVDLCGHATLAAAKIVFEHLQPQLAEVVFHTRSGRLGVAKRGRMLAMDFPSQPGVPCDGAEPLADALGAAPDEVLRSIHYDMAIFRDSHAVQGLRPDARRLLNLDRLGVIATAPGEDVDFVSRFFAPKAGVDEDPVTGSAHCVSTPYWAARTGRNELRARQISKRGGELWCTLRGDRVSIAGHAVIVLEGTLLLSDTGDSISD